MHKVRNKDLLMCLDSISGTVPASRERLAEIVDLLWSSVPLGRLE